MGVVISQFIALFMVLVGLCGSLIVNSVLFSRKRAGDDAPVAEAVDAPR